MRGVELRLVGSLILFQTKMLLWANELCLQSLIYNVLVVSSDTTVLNLVLPLGGIDERASDKAWACQGEKGRWSGGFTVRIRWWECQRRWSIWRSCSSTEERNLMSRWSLGFGTHQLQDYIINFGMSTTRIAFNDSLLLHKFSCSMWPSRK